MQDKLQEQLEKYCWNEHHFEPLANYERLESFIDQNFIGKEEVKKMLSELYEYCSEPSTDEISDIMYEISKLLEQLK